MGFFYIDESIHYEAGFILAACVYTISDLSPAVDNVLQSLEYHPGTDEFKSSASKSADERSRILRGKIKSLIYLRAKVGLVVIPSTDRSELGRETLIGLNKIITNNNLSDKPHDIFFDEGISTYINGSKEMKILTRENNIYWGQDSRSVGGLQVADCAAHTMSIMLKEEMGLLSKKVKAGENSGYDPDLEINLGFELWASLRYSIFGDYTRSIDSIEDDPVGSLVFNTWDYAVHVSNSCNKTLIEHIKNRFGTNYLGCIH